ncbi:MAG: hypothetical protein ACOYLQ_09590 [Hyphomicrobiaceae bacterium]
MLDLTRIPDLEARQKLLEIHKRQKELHENRPSLSIVRPRSFSSVPEIAAAWEQYDRLVNEYHARCAAEDTEADKDIIKELAALEMEESELGLADIEVDDDDEARFCALTGLPILDGDDVIKDEETGDWILRDALPWPDEPA